MQVEGGDLSAIDGPAVVSLTVGGAADGEPIPRRAAKAGWTVAVTGPLGKSAVALREHRVLRPEPLIEQGIRLNELGLCCGDISDGLVREMEKFAQMAGVGYRLDARKVPVAAGATLADALTSGEEVHLVCAGPAERIREAGLQAVGELTEHGAAIDGLDEVPRGYDHFA
jgi:thiamine monophosphate kinase